MSGLVRRSPLLWVGVAVVLAVGWYLISPLFIRTSLVEAPASVAGAALKRGTFNEIDAIHKGRGTATLTGIAGGRLRVELADFSVTNGPDLHVFLSRHAAPDGDAQAKDGVLLGTLKASEGAFAYETDAAVDPVDVKSVVIHCVRFRTIFSYATLA